MACCHRAAAAHPCGAPRPLLCRLCRLGRCHPWRPGGRLWRRHRTTCCCCCCAVRRCPCCHPGRRPAARRTAVVAALALLLPRARHVRTQQPSLPGRRCQRRQRWNAAASADCCSCQRHCRHLLQLQDCSRQAPHQRAAAGGRAGRCWCWCWCWQARTRRPHPGRQTLPAGRP